MSLSPKSVKHDEDQRQFYIQFEDGTRALLDYVISSPGVYEFYHTETPVEKRGQGLAAIVSTAAMQWIRDNQYKVILTCSYLKNDFLRKNEEWKDVVIEN